MANTELSNRSEQSESTYNRRWLLAVIAGPLALGLTAAGWMATVAGSLPDQLASHWGPDGVDGYSSLWGMAAVAVFASGGTGAVVAGLSVLTRGYSAVIARIGVGLGIALGVLMTGLAVAVVAGQIGLADASQAEIDSPVMWISAVAGCVAGAVCGWLYRPGEVDRTPDADTVAADADAASEDSAVAAAARRAAANRESMVIKISMGPVSWLLSLGTGAAVAMSLVFVHPALALLGLPAAALIWIFCSGNAVIDDAGVRVLAGGFWKLMPLEYREITSVSVQDIQALDFGGWGYRISPAGTGFIVRSGPALILTGGSRPKCVISMPDAETAGRACSLVRAYGAS
ncbi:MULTISPECIES: hypothetical protein [Arthrobacter]|uniref:DUF1648 domain-containing protein n=1 Tax=Arthrobacter caoxuetaonis TaxID=2886935 RepID=A0A9X1MAG7_9MICC|nr:MULTISPECIES: hypothetical protein [Arthrobacter]MCC3281368.1 hypothetical protein [Arthrobacter caoxuetaonis]MCC3296379.1 hypothetical protein [Arthrobacter caoxuetaonis]MCC9192455.1 hypothetical protein [Arthrobacter sp. zg-Y916]USQ56780.1 hypothetical protein NF551_13690 [Arthrobacter caoxuetaonis]